MSFRNLLLAGALLSATAVPVAVAAPGPQAAATGPAASFDAVVRSITALPYQPAYVPVGLDSAFPSPTPNVAPAQDYTSGSIPGSPDAPAFPPPFKQVLLHSADGAPFFAQVALQPGPRPGVVVVHGFNTHGYESVVRWAAMLAANGYDVIAADQRDYSFEYSAGLGYPNWLQTFGWKEAQDVVAAGAWLRAQPGVTGLGVVGFSEGAQNTVLAMAQSSIFDAGLTFSGPADQNTQIYSGVVPPGCQGSSCSYPVTDALVALVVPPNTYSDPCTVLADAADRYGTTRFDILAHETAMHAQTKIKVPLLNFYAADDPLVPAFEARMMAGYETGASLQRTLEIEHGGHAYYFDRWWQQQAILRYFAALLPHHPANPPVTATATVNRTPGGSPLADQLVDLGQPTRTWSDSQLAPFVCDTWRGIPGEAEPAG